MMTSQPKVVYVKPSLQTLSKEPSFVVYLFHQFPGTGQTRTFELAIKVYSGEPVILLERGTGIWTQYQRMIMPTGDIGWVYDPKTAEHSGIFCWYKTEP